MFRDNLISLRKMRGLSQEELAEKIGVTRQTLSKYETGESLPDIEKCKAIADVFEISIDELINSEGGTVMPGGAPKGKYVFGIVKVGEKGQIVLPARARKIFGIETGDHFIVLGDENSGIALIKESGFMDLVSQVGKAERE